MMIRVYPYLQYARKKIGETEIKWIIGLKQIRITLILSHLYKTILMDISSGNRRRNFLRQAKSMPVGD